MKPILYILLGMTVPSAFIAGKLWGERNTDARVQETMEQCRDALSIKLTEANAKWEKFSIDHLNGAKPSP